MKIPLQEKIAELETRIAGLELRAAAVEHTLRSERRTVRVTTTEWLRHRDMEGFHTHWREMWQHFDAAMKAFFKG